ncbi:MAG: sulfite exporter TauE/SafE family protein [Armatimonadetes bacterium]|nr:sulfite exporter TauE/SafE family protein [Armatimonadota bacterium]
MPTDELSTTALWLIGVVSAFAGGLGAMLGIGGGIILVPVLISVFGVDAIHARTASLVAVCVTSMAGSLVYLREGETDLVSAGYLQLPTAIGAVLGAIVGGRFDEELIRFLFAITVVIVAIRMLLPDRAGGASTRKSWTYAALACVAGGLLSSILGVGGGIVFVPVLALLLSLPQRAASATSTYLIGLTAAASALIYFTQGQMDAVLAIPTALGILIGAQAGARLSGFVSRDSLRRAFAVVMFVNAFLLLKGVLGIWLA